MCNKRDWMKKRKDCKSRQVRKFKTVRWKIKLSNTVWFVTLLLGRVLSYFSELVNKFWATLILFLCQPRLINKFWLSIAICKACFWSYAHLVCRNFQEYRQEEIQVVGVMRSVIFRKKFRSLSRHAHSTQKDNEQKELRAKYFLLRRKLWVISNITPIYCSL